MEQTELQNAQIIHAPSRRAITGRASVFLSGTTTGASGSDWRQMLTTAVAHLPVTVLNPLRPDWATLLPEDGAHAPFREQVEWELDMHGRADMVVAYFGPDTDAPVSLLEFGLCARSGRALVVCHRDYRKRGNVQVVCERLGVPCLDADHGWVAAVVGRLEEVIQTRAENPRWDD